MSVHVTYFRPGDRRDGSWVVVAELRDDDHPHVSFGVTAVQDDDGRLFIKNLNIHPRMDVAEALDRRVHEVTRRLLRAVKVDEILAALIDALISGRESDGPDVLGKGWSAARPSVADANRELVPARGRPRTRTPDHLRDIARSALELEADGEGRVTARLASLFGRSPTEIRDDLREAARQGWLAPPLKQGARSGRQPGPKLRAWLQQPKGSNSD